MEGKERSEEEHSRRRKEKPKGRKKSLKKERKNVVRHLLINMIMQYLQIVTINGRKIVLNRIVFQSISLPFFLFLFFQPHGKHREIEGERGREREGRENG